MLQAAPQQTCSAIKSQLEEQPVESQWRFLLNHIRALHPMWVYATEDWAAVGELPDEKRNKHLDVIHAALDRMDDWRFERVKYVKARRNEIDSAISFIWNSSIQSPFRTLLIAPVIRNLGSLLRGCLYIAAHGYRDDQLPTLIAQDVFEVAAVRTLFPIDTANFVSFLKDGESIHGDGGDFDNYHLMLDRGAEHYDIQPALAALYHEAAVIWPPTADPDPVILDDAMWRKTGDGLSAKMHYDAIRAFHARD